MKQSMSYINHLRQTNSGKNIVHSQLFKAARILVSFIVIAILCETGWLFTQDEKFLLSNSAFIIVAQAVILMLIWQGTNIIEGAFIQRDKAMNALRKNEAKFKSFLDTNFIGILKVNTDGSICVANEEFLRITGYTNSYLQSGKLNWFDITPSKYKDVENKCFLLAKAVGNGKPYEKDLICADGKLIKVKVGCSYVEENINQPQYIVHISECNQIEQNTVFEHWLENLLDMIPAPLLLIEPGTARVTFANKAANTMHGGTFPLAQSQEEYSKLYRFSDAQGKVIPLRLAPPIRVANGERLEGVELNWHQGENIYQVKVFADALPAINGYPAFCFVLFQDIAQLKQLEASLKLGNDRLNLIFGTTNDLISFQQPEELIEVLYGEIAEQLGLDCYLYYLVNKDSQIIQLNSYSGITCSQASYLQYQKFGQGISGTVAQQRRAINIENVEEFNEFETKSTDSEVIAAYYSCPLLAQEQLLGIISFGSRTRSSFNDYEIGIMQAVCNQIAVAIQRANLMNSLQQANHMKDEFLGILSHELRSPLNSILGWAQYLQVRKLDETTTSKALESIERNSRELNNVIEQLLDMSQTIQGKMQLNIENCNLASIIATVTENLRSTSCAKQIEIKLSFSKSLQMDKHIDSKDFADTIESLKHLSSLNTISTDDAIRWDSNFLVAGDRERLSQVMWNLLSNAIKFTSCGGCIEVRLLEEETTNNSLSYAVIQVSDTGIGINSELIPYVFDRFRQADSSSTRAHSGLGLGLSIVRHIVELHGGSVFVESPGIGLGSTFTVKLPLLTSNESQFIKKKFKQKYVVIH